MKASDQYQWNYQTIESQLSQLKALLVGHAYDLEPDWTDVGDLGHIIGELAEIIEFLGGDRNAAEPGRFWTTSRKVIERNAT